MGLLTRVIVLVTPPTMVVTTWACWATVTVPDLCTVMIGRVGVLGVEMAEVPTCAAAVFSIRVAGLVTWNGSRNKDTSNHEQLQDRKDIIRMIHVRKDARKGS